MSPCHHNKCVGVKQAMTATMKDFSAMAADWAALPMVLTVEELSAVLGIGQSKAYRLMSEPGFPSVKIGKTSKVYRDGLRRYLETRLES